MNEPETWQRRPNASYMLFRARGLHHPGLHTLPSRPLAARPSFTECEHHSVHPQRITIWMPRTNNVKRERHLLLFCTEATATAAHSLPWPVLPSRTVHEYEHWQFLLSQTQPACITWRLASCSRKTWDTWDSFKGRSWVGGAERVFSRGINWVWLDSRAWNWVSVATPALPYDGHVETKSEAGCEWSR